MLGQHFLEEVAPGTNVQELAGWLSEAAAAKRSDRKRMKLIFDFPRGRQLVEISLVHDGAEGISTLTVEATE